MQRNFSPLADEDGDGLVTAQEFLLGTNPTDADSDDDGLNDGAEDTAGTDPLNAGSRLVVASVVIAQGGAVDLTVASTAGRYYTLQSSTELGEWVDEPEAMAVPGTGAVLTLHDANPDAGRKFYRIAVRR